MHVCSLSVTTKSRSSPCTAVYLRALTQKFISADVSSSVRVGALGAESVQYSYVAMHRLVMYTTICRPYGSASRLPIGQQYSSSGSFNLFESKLVSKDKCGGGGGSTSPPIAPPQPARSPLGLLHDPARSWSSEFSAPTTRRWGGIWHLPRAVLVPPDQGLATDARRRPKRANKCRPGPTAPKRQAHLDALKASTPMMMHSDPRESESEDSE